MVMEQMIYLTDLVSYDTKLLLIWVYLRRSHYFLLSNATLVWTESKIAVDLEYEYLMTGASRLFLTVLILHDIYWTGL